MKNIAHYFFNIFHIITSILLIISCVFIQGCSMSDVAKGIPKLLGNTKSVSGGDTGGYIGSIKPTLNTGHASSYDRSNIDRSDESKHLTTSQDKNIFAAVNKDNSKNNTNVKTNKARDKYNAEVQSVNNAPILNQIITALNSWFSFIIGFILAYCFGKSRGYKKHKREIKDEK